MPLHICLRSAIQPYIHPTIWWSHVLRMSVPSVTRVHTRLPPVKVAALLSAV